jgi:thioredoxin 1
MSEIDDIREQNIEELAAEEDADAAGEDAPNEPFYLDGAEELNQAAQNYDVVLTDFYADWCGRCQMLEAIVETIAADIDAAVAKVDVDTNQ